MLRHAPYSTWRPSSCRGGGGGGGGGSPRWGMTPRQVSLCRSTLEAMPHLAKAAQLAVTTCRQVFADRRWNCSSLEALPRLSPDLYAGTREQAFVYALSAAAATYSVARACAQGALPHCSCAGPPRDPPNGNFKWGGCGDNVRYGALLARQFADAAERGGGVQRDDAVQAAPSAAPSAASPRSFSHDDLIFLTKSPDYCLPDPRTGSLGTRGRSCNASSNGFDSCQDMCCGRGFRTVTVEKVERCQCKYYWCCYVRCKTCTSWVDIHECL
ncbi:protein Wnt-11b-2-like [Thrips palmi]|uniref:Protein Wnt n=1 Tax=Thrips palmi TaxID=161013 RepID=A0A6P8ZLK7_THRPL|nr:protein Wnt-11b-2-like [Thrips palmi]